jgi:hypothetical protein
MPYHIAERPVLSAAAGLSHADAPARDRTWLDYRSARRTVIVIHPGSHQVTA